ncbi:site-2 protease family protein [Roseomonas sp. SSH11]|uniref:Site-2 protease family protein n=1 Tax=Pararoseomonas baculiformis TaxID=2820812 RepID=A0ABS4AAD8_9PROT|nr:site-2 protease family protein [Pararoseomonas baculiformis]MBP0443971.1 site-2 protease family protein [Pararoseomonas baculiformis]
MDWLPDFAAAALAAILAITLHEAAHGYAARALGDDTAARMGRLSLNPLRHVDPVGTLLVPGLLLISQLLVSGRVDVMFGWAKPVPVNIMALRNPRFGMVLVAAAGPAINVALAVAAAILLHPLQGPGGDNFLDWIEGFLILSLIGNLVLAAFNLLPIPPLDGGRILGGLLPPVIGIPFLRLERAGLFIVLGVLFLVPMAVPGFDPLRSLVSAVVLPGARFILAVTGHGG